MKKKCVFCRKLSCFLLLFCLLCLLLLLLLFQSLCQFFSFVALLLFFFSFLGFLSREVKLFLFFFFNSSVLQFFKEVRFLLRFVFVQIKNGTHYIVSQRAAVWRDHR